MSVETHPVWRIVAAASVAAIPRTLPRGAQPPRQRQSDLVSFTAGDREEDGSSAVPRTTRGLAEVLREGSGINVDGTAGDGPTMSIPARVFSPQEMRIAEEFADMHPF